MTREEKIAKARKEQKRYTEYLKARREWEREKKARYEAKLREEEIK